MFRSCFAQDVTLIAMAPRTLYAVLDETTNALRNSSAMYQPTGGKSGAASISGHTAGIEYRQTVQQIACALRTFGITKGRLCSSSRGTQRRILHGRSRNHQRMDPSRQLVHEPCRRPITFGLWRPHATEGHHRRGRQIVAALFVQRALTQRRSGFCSSGEAEGATTFDQMREVAPSGDGRRSRPVRTNQC